MSERRGARTFKRAARAAAVAVVIAALGASCTCGSKDTKPEAMTSPSASSSAKPSVSASPDAANKAPTADATASAAPSAAASGDPSTWTFVRERPEERAGVDACAYLGFMGFACLEALMAEKDPMLRRYMLRLSDADARIAKDLYERGEGPGIPHAELYMLCADKGPCGKKDENGNVLDDGYACLTKAQTLEFQGDKLEAAEAHKRACKCGAERAQIPIMGGYLACDGPNKPVVRGGNLKISEAQNIRACAECDAKTGPAACAREIATLAPSDPELAKYIETVHVPRCQKP